METLALLIVAAIPTTIGTAEAVKAQKKQQDAERHRAKFNIKAKFKTKNDARKVVTDDCFMVLKDGNVQALIFDGDISNGTEQMFFDHSARPVQGHKFCGYYFDYPGIEDCRGLVSSIQDDPPMLNWIFVDKDTLELRYGSRKDSLDHVVGPWNWTEDEANVTLEDDEGFVVIEQEDGRWKVYYDREGDRTGLPRGKTKEICLRRQLMCGMTSSYIRT